MAAPQAHNLDAGIFVSWPLSRNIFLSQSLGCKGHVIDHSLLEPFAADMETGIFFVLL